jgi:hypothetical protein
VRTGREGIYRLCFVEAMGIEPTNLLHAMQFLGCTPCFLRPSQLACVRFCPDTKVLRDKGFMVQPAVLSPKRPFP